MKLLEHKISAICMHTNLDIVSGGVNDALAAIAGLSVIGPLADGGIDQSGKIYGIGRTGKLGRKMPMSEFLAFLKNALHTNGLRYYDSGRPVYHVAVGGGSCGEYLEEAVKLGCDTFLTADIKYDSFLDARYYQLNLIDGDHFCTENVVTPVLLRWLSKAFPDLNVQISKSHGQTVQFF
jgi:putative NIF3 family GTP cyclohydrolase 1 type 2